MGGWVSGWVGGRRKEGRTGATGGGVPEDEVVKSAQGTEREGEGGAVFVEVEGEGREEEGRGGRGGGGGGGALNEEGKHVVFVGEGGVGRGGVDRFHLFDFG